MLKKYLEKELRLKVNEEKPEIRRLNQTKYLGYGFYKSKGRQFKVYPDSLQKFKIKLKKTTGRSNGLGHKHRKNKNLNVIKKLSFGIYKNRSDRIRKSIKCISN